MKQSSDKSSSNFPTESGYVLLAVMILVTLSAIVMASALGTSSNFTQSVRATKDRSTEFFSAETSLAGAISWLRQNSSSIVLAFSRTNFYANFDKSSPSVGSNDTTGFPILTKIKARGNNKSIVLSNNSSYFTPEFPSTLDASTGATFAATTSFSASSLGSDTVRITLVDAVAKDPAKDFGDIDSGNPSPETDFYPVFRVDALNSDAQGGYLQAYVVGALSYNYGIGFYGRDLLDLRQKCDSYISNNGAYSDASKRANCPVGSNSTLEIHQNELVYGTARTNSSINETAPYGGKVCSDFTAGCPNAGEKCEGASCSVPGLPTYSTWTTYCPSNQGDLTINSNSTLTVPGNAANQKCWNKIKVNAGKTLTLRTTNYSYFIDTFDIANNAVINFSPNPATGTINLYVKKFVGDKFNGNQVFNTNNKPYQLRIHYLGTDALTLNGTAAMSAFLVAPYAGVEVSGTFDYSGGIKATSLACTGSGKLHYDESGDITTLSDVTFKTRNVNERYR